VTWVNIDDSWLTHPKAACAGKDGRALWLAALLYAARELTDGFIPTAALPLIAATAEVRPAAHKKLIEPWREGEAPLWEPVEGGWRIHDYHDYQPAAETVRDKRARDRERKAKGRANQDRNPATGRIDSGESPEDVRTESTTDTPGNPARVTPVPYPFPIPTHVSSPTGLGTSPPPANDDELIEAVIRARYDRIGKPPPSPKLIAAVAKGLDHDRIRQLAADGSDPVAIDQILDGINPTGPAKPVENPVHPAVHATTKPGCPDCDGQGVVLDDIDAAHPCPTCNRSLIA
jgi:hypothetical protein